MVRSGNRITRQLCVITVLLGIVGMHGLAQGQDDGCHGGAALVATTAAAMPAMDPAVPQLAAGTHGMGSLCVAVQSAGWPALAIALLAIIGLAMSSGPRTRWSIGGQSGRSPPLAGVSLLRRVCVSLT